MNKPRDLGIDILCCTAAVMLLMLRFIDATGFLELPFSPGRAALPVLLRQVCLAGAAMLAAGAGCVLSRKRFSMGYYRILIRLVYVYVVCSLLALLLRGTLLHETFTFGEAVRDVVQFRSTGTAAFAGMFFGLLVAAPFLNAAWQGLPNRGARRLFWLLLAGAATLQPILRIGEVCVLPEWCAGLFPAAAYIGGAYVRRYGTRPRRDLLLILLAAVPVLETCWVVITSMPQGRYDCPWLDSLAALPAHVIAISLLSLCRSRVAGATNIHRFFAGAAGGALAGLLLGDPIVRAAAESIPASVGARIAVGLVLVPIVFALCCGAGFVLQLPLLTVRRRLQDQDAEREDGDAPKRRRTRVLIPGRTHTTPLSDRDGDPRHTIRVEVAQPERAVRMTVPEEEIPAGCAVVTTEETPEMPETIGDTPVPADEADAPADEGEMKIYTPHTAAKDVSAGDPGEVLRRIADEE